MAPDIVASPMRKAGALTCRAAANVLHVLNLQGRSRSSDPGTEIECGASVGGDRTYFIAILRRNVVQVGLAELVTFRTDGGTDDDPLDRRPGPDESIDHRFDDARLESPPSDMGETERPGVREECHGRTIGSVYGDRPADLTGDDPVGLEHVATRRGIDDRRAMDLANHGPLTVHDQCAPLGKGCAIGVDVQIAVRECCQGQLDGRSIGPPDSLDDRHLSQERRNVEIVVAVEIGTTIAGLAGLIGLIVALCAIGEDIGNLELIIVGGDTEGGC